MERTAVAFVNIQITEYSVKGDAIVRKKGLNIYVIFSNKKKNIKIYLPIWHDKNVKKKHYFLWN